MNIICDRMMNTSGKSDMEYERIKIDGQVRFCPKCNAPRTGSHHVRDGVTVFEEVDEICLYQGKGNSVREGVMMMYTHRYAE